MRRMLASIVWHTHWGTRRYAHAHTTTHTHTRLHAGSHTHTHTCRSARTDKHTHTHTHNYTHTHTHTFFNLYKKRVCIFIYFLLFLYFGGAEYKNKIYNTCAGTFLNKTHNKHTITRKYIRPCYRCLDRVNFTKFVEKPTSRAELSMSTNRQTDRQADTHTHTHK